MSTRRDLTLASAVAYSRLSHKADRAADSAKTTREAKNQAAQSKRYADQAARLYATHYRAQARRTDPEETQS